MTTVAKRERMAEAREYEKCQVLDFCEENGLSMISVNEYQIRINDILDIYPTAKKYCFLPKKEWGMYNKIEIPIEKYIWKRMLQKRQ